MAIAKLKLIDIIANTNDLDAVISRFIDIKSFHPVLATEILDSVQGLTSFVTENPCQPLLQELDEIEKKFSLNLPDVNMRDCHYDLHEMKDYMTQIKESLENEIGQIKNLESDIVKYKDAIVQVQNLESLDIPLEDLFHLEFISFRFGRLPNDSLDKLKFFQSRPFMFKSFTKDLNNSWCMYITTKEHRHEIDNIFSSLFFERIYIPGFIEGRPREAIASLEAKIAEAQAKIDEYKEDIYDISCGCSNKLSCIKGELLFLNKTFEAKKYVIGLGDKFMISGFVEEENVHRVEAAFGDILEKVEIEIREADADKRIKPPTKLKNGWFSKPFGMFVEMYGLPGYKDMDPTPFVALTYALLFGIMFADVGHGLVLLLIGWFAQKKKGMALGGIGVRIGLSAMLFGLIFGSVFGNETILDPMYRALGFAGKPIHVMSPDFTMILLISAVGIGALLILSVMILNIMTLIKKKDYAKAIVSHNGVAGFLFYGFLFVGIILQMGLGLAVFNIVTILLLIIVPLLAIFLKEPLERKFKGEPMFPTGFGGFFAEGFFELFETVLSYVTNSMSFLRVGGFALAHAGMMLVVFSLMAMFGTTGSIITLIFGNIFVIALEGLIVGIQVLRLEFYELFSRFYEGNGVQFKSLNL